MKALELHDLWVEAPGPSGVGHPVAGVSLSLEAGKALGLVGLSGAGKSLTACALAGLVPPPLRVTQGRLLLGGRQVPLADASAWRGLRGREVLLLMQMSGTALNPYLRVGVQLEEALREVRGLDRGQARRTAGLALERVGLNHQLRQSHPHQLSGGMGRRVLLALAWALRPRVLIADEPTTGLDPSQKAAIQELLRDLTQRQGTALLYISHDLRSVAAMAPRLLVMSEGRIVDSGPVSGILAGPQQALSRELAASLSYLEGRRV